MTSEELKAIKERYSRKLEILFSSFSEYRSLAYADRFVDDDEIAYAIEAENAEYIVDGINTTIPALLAEVDRLEEELKSVTYWIKKHDNLLRERNHMRDVLEKISQYDSAEGNIAVAALEAQE